MSIVKKALKQMSALRFFMTQHYSVVCGNMINTWSSLSPSDQAKFDFDCKPIIWDTFIRNYWPGLRKYAFKQKDEEEDAARKHLKKVTYISTSVELLLIILILSLIAFIIRASLSHFAF